MKYSKQRELILQVVETSCDHPSAIQVYERVASILPKISLGTVYRNLNVLVEVGLIKRLSDGDYDRFDATMCHHDHFRCVLCGGIVDVQHPLLSQLDEQIMNETGYLIQNHELIFTGVCDSCKRERKI